MAFNTFCFASFCVNLMHINPNLYELGVKHEYLEYDLNLTVRNYKTLENSLESNVHLAIEMTMHGLVSNASREALKVAKGLTDHAKSQGKDVKRCSKEFEKTIMAVAEGIVEDMGFCLNDVEKKYNKLAYDIQTGIKNSMEVASIVKVLGFDCNGLEDDEEQQCFKAELETYLIKHEYLKERYLKHVENYRVILVEAEKAIKCIGEHKQDISTVMGYTLQQIASCIASI